MRIYTKSSRPSTRRQGHSQHPLSVWLTRRLELKETGAFKMAAS